MNHVLNGYFVWEPPLDPPDQHVPKPIQELTYLDIDLEEVSRWYDDYTA